MDAIGSKNVRTHSRVGGFDKGVARDQQKPRSIIISTCRDVVHSTRYLVPRPPPATSRSPSPSPQNHHYWVFAGWILVTSVPIQQNLESLSLLSLLLESARVLFLLASGKFDTPEYSRPLVSSWSVSDSKTRGLFLISLIVV